MVFSNIKVFIRVRPCARPSSGFSAEAEKGALAFEFDKTTPDGQVNNSKTLHKFNFDGILPMQASQQDVFERVAKPVIDDVLQGINGTIFAYGQTGSGKTFTITGGAERYEDRGLIPRTISYLFQAFKANPACKHSLYISYLEIYNNDGYDLLSREDTATKLEDLPKVSLREDEEGNIKLRNLSVNMAQREEDALNLLFLGDTNRVVAETPMNDASTRSHCMFIMWVESTKPDSDVVRRAKLHLVDLAGSERIGKTGVEGKLKQEATAINLSLHYLEQVIVALHERSSGRRQHVPYRNSILTSVLRDSLGGNCRTLMVGTVATEESNLDESVSTCRFAQRVACIKNNAMVNEELDPALMIRRLKKEAAQLKDELAMMSGGDEEGELGEEDLSECRKLVTGYLEETDPQALFVCGSVKRFRECFQILRQVYWQRESDGGLGEEASAARSGSRGVSGSGTHAITGGSSGSAAAAANAPAPGTLEATVLELREQVARRDQEIGLLLSSLNKRSGKGVREAAAAKDVPVFIKGSRNMQEEVANPSNSNSGGNGHDQPSCAKKGSIASSLSHAESAALLLDRNKAFEVFRKSVRRSETLEDNKEVIKKLKAEAQGLGLTANGARDVISGNQSRIQKLRMERAMESNPRDPDAQVTVEDTPDIVALLKENEEKKHAYRQAMERLKQVKAEIETHMKAIEQNKLRLQRDFEAWYHALEASSGGGGDEGCGEGDPHRSRVGAHDIMANSFGDQQVGPEGIARQAQTVSTPLVVPAVPSKPSIATRAMSSASSVRSEADSSARASPALGAARPSHVAVATAGAAAAEAEHRQLLTHGDRPMPAISAWAPVDSDDLRRETTGLPPAVPVRPPEVGTHSSQSVSKPRPIDSEVCQPSAALTPVSAPAAGSPPPPVAATTPSGVNLTGDAQTDRDIAAYFEALAALNG